MPLTLTVKSYQRLSPDQDAAKSLATGSLSIGRSGEADWTLPDPDRQISKLHCRIDAVGDGYVLTDTSTNGVFINGASAPVGRDNAVQLSAGDQVRLGDYEIEVAIAEATAGAGGQGQETTAGPVPALEDPFPDPLLAGPPVEAQAPQESLPDVPTPRYADEPKLFELDKDDQARPVEQPRLLGVPDGPQKETPPPPGAAPDHLPGDRAFFEAPNLVSEPARPEAGPTASGLLSASGQAGGGIPADWDDEPEPAGAAAPAPPEPAQAAPQATPAQTIPEDWSLEAEAQPPSPPAAAPPAPSAPATTIPDDWDLDAAPSEPAAADQTAPAPAIPDDWDAGETAPEPPAAQPEAAAGADTPRTESTWLDEPPPAPEPTPAPPPEPTPAAAPRPTPGVRPAPAQSPAGAPGTGGALQAFLEGAALEVPPISDADAEVLMRTMGEVYRILVQGMMEVLAARSSLKNEFRVEQTTIQPVQNNPLKFSLNVDNAMENLLLKRGKGYMSPVEAMQEAFGDLQAHQIATLAGMQSALQSVVARFDPEALEERLEKSSMLESILPGKRKARYWDTFNQLFREIAKEAEDDFQKLFGQAFAEAYEKEIRKR